MYFLMYVLGILLFFNLIKAIKELNITYKKILKEQRKIKKSLNTLHQNIDCIYNICLDNNDILINENESISNFLDEI